MLKHSKRVLGVLLVGIIAFTCMNYTVNAEEDLSESKECKNWIKEKASLLKDSYGISIQYIDPESNFLWIT